MALRKKKKTNETIEEMLMKKIPTFTSRAVMRKRKVESQSPQPEEEIVNTVMPENIEEMLMKKIPAEKNSKMVSSPQKEFLDIFRKLTDQYNSLDIWHDFIIMFACSLFNPFNKRFDRKLKKLYLQTVNKYKKQEQELFRELASQTVLALELNPEQDFLGSIFMSLNLGNENDDWTFRSYDICKEKTESMVGDVLLKVERDGYISINDSCCSTGALLIAEIHAAKKQLDEADINYQNHIFVTAHDAREVAALMCYIQLSILGVAGYVKIDDPMIHPTTNIDDEKNYWFTPMYFSNIWVIRRILGRC